MLFLGILICLVECYVGCLLLLVFGSCLLGCFLGDFLWYCGCLLFWLFVRVCNSVDIVHFFCFVYLLLAVRLFEFIDCGLVVVSVLG